MAYLNTAAAYAAILAAKDTGNPADKVTWAELSNILRSISDDIDNLRTIETNYVSTALSYSNPAWLTGLAWSKVSGTPTTLAGYGITDAVATSGAQTIAGIKTFSDIVNATAGVGTTGATDFRLFANNAQVARFFQSTGNFVIGSSTTDGGFKLDVNGTLRTTGRAEFDGVSVWKGGGAVSSNIAIGASALNANTTGSNNIALGVSTLRLSTSGSDNIAIGHAALEYSVSGSIANTAVGVLALNANTTGNHNSAFGYQALRANTTGVFNTAVGLSALSTNTTGSNNTAVGLLALAPKVTGSLNSAFGVNAGRLIATGANLTAANNSIFLGGNTRALADNSTNEIVIGTDVIGLGNNTVVLGNSSVVLTALRGQIGIGTTAPVASAQLQVDSTTRGVLIPRMTTSQRTAIASPATGLILYDTDLGHICYYDGSSWRKISHSAA